MGEHYLPMVLVLVRYHILEVNNLYTIDAVSLWEGFY